MPDHVPPDWSFEDARTLYGIDRWGNGYFDINDAGRVCVSPDPEGDCCVDLIDLVDQAESLGLSLPVLFRFNGIIRDRLAKIHGSFDRCIQEYGYKNRYRCVFPIKVNQQWEVVHQVTEHGRAFGAGIEAGSKAELIAVIAASEDDTLIICNGFKDAEYIRIALTAKQMGRTIIPVIEKVNELDLLLDIAAEMDIEPTFGMRVKLASQGSGRWRASAGCRSKFGLTIGEVLEQLSRLVDLGKQTGLELLHFHIGSQVGNIQDLKSAIVEGARIYAELYRLGAGLKRLDVGGGLGVDYDGSRSDTASSRNYSTQEYANDVVFHVQSVCDQLGVPHPELISESGRAVSASHSVLVINTFGVASATMGAHGSDADELRPPDPDAVEPPIRELWDTLQELSLDNLRESFHDAQSSFELCLNLFSSGYLPIEQRAFAERLHAVICRRICDHVSRLPTVPNELQKLERMFADIYYANFSIFQSLPDAWAIDQLFPLMPLERLGERPTRHAVLSDITCDSDGLIQRFRVGGELRDTIPLHRISEGQPYRLGLFLVGAYQEILGDLHNLFGDTHAVHVDVDAATGKAEISSTIFGDTLAEVLGYLQYDEHLLASRLQESVDAARAEGRFDNDNAQSALNLFHRALLRYTYLLPSAGMAEGG